MRNKKRIQSYFYLFVVDIEEKNGGKEQWGGEARLVEARVRSCLRGL